MTISGSYDVIIYFFKFIFSVFEHRKSFEGGTFSSFCPELPLYLDNPLPLALYCFCFFNFSTLFILTSFIFSCDLRVRLSSFEMSDWRFILLVPWESSVNMPPYPIFCIMEPWDIFASNEFVRQLIGVPIIYFIYQGQFRVKMRSNGGQIFYIPFWWMFRVTIRPWLLSSALVLPREQIMLAISHFASPISKSVNFWHNVSVIFLPDFWSFCINWSNTGFVFGPSVWWSRHLITVW